MSTDVRRSNSAKKSKKSRKAAKRRRNRIILFIVEAIVVAILGVVLWAVFKGTQAQKLNVEPEISEPVKEYYEKEKVMIDGQEKTLSEAYKQVAFFGVDSREGELAMNTRSDSIIIASLNVETKEIKLCSVFRDTYLNLSDDTYNKCNSAYAKGGPEQAINMLNQNLDLNITDYVTVGFKGVVNTVDALGGVDIDITDAEIHFLNDYQYCIAEDLGLSNYTKVETPGVQTLNGLQACAYCRIRYTAGDDFKRAERQRTVITKMIEKAKTMNPATLNQIANDTMPNISTSFDASEIIDYIADAPNYQIIGQDGFPFAEYRTTGTIGQKGSCVIPTDLATNVSELHKFLYGVENYEPSDRVKECSQKISSDTSPYL